MQIETQDKEYLSLYYVITSLKDFNRLGFLTDEYSLNHDQLAKKKQPLAEHEQLLLTLGRHHSQVELQAFR